MGSPSGSLDPFIIKTGSVGGGWLGLGSTTPNPPSPNKCLLRIEYKSSFVNGLARISDIPLWRYVTRSLSSMFPVMAIMGVLVSNDRMTAVAVAPSRLGITMSIKTKSYFVVSTVEIAFNPSVTTVTWQPYFTKNFRHNWMHTLSSSTKRTWNLGLGMLVVMTCGTSAPLGLPPEMELLATTGVVAVTWPEVDDSLEPFGS